MSEGIFPRPANEDDQVIELENDPQVQVSHFKASSLTCLYTSRVLTSSSFPAAPCPCQT